MLRRAAMSLCCKGSVCCLLVLPVQVLRILADLFAKRVGPVMGVAATAATKAANGGTAVPQ